MSIFGEAAQRAAAACQKDPGRSPVNAWATAIKQVTSSPDTQKKCCPRNAFLGLCSAGLVAGIAAGEYTRSKLNAIYAVDAVKLLERHPALAENKLELWRRVAGTEKRPNGQMDVVIALREGGFLTRSNR